MLARIQNAAAGEIEHARGSFRICGALAAVKGLCGAEVDAAPAQLPCPHSEIHVLEVHEEPLIEAAKRLEHATSHEEECAHHLVHDARRVMRPLSHEMGRKSRRRKPV